MINKLKELRNSGSEEGFTLIELMIVVVIIGILAAIAIPIFANQQKSAITAGVKSDVKNTTTNIATALAKIPTATSVAGTAAGATGSGTVSTTTPAASAPFAIVVSDAATNITVAGTWDNYYVLGTNTGVGGTRATATPAPGGATLSSGTDVFGIVYNSVTGKQVQVGG